MSKEDFFITDVKITSNQLNIVPNSSYNYGSFPRPVFHYKIVNYNDIQPRLKRKKDLFQEPFIFFGKKIIGKLIEGENLTYSNEPSMYYEYVAFNEGRFSKTAKFKKLEIKNSSFNPYSFPDVDINIIEKEALIELGIFILQQRQQDPTFCKTIYTAVEAVVSPQQQNNE